MASLPVPHPLRVLVVEDDLDQGHLVRFLLEATGRYAVTLVQDGVGATALLESEPWDLLITDLNLPGENGIAVVRASRRLRPDTPILATTSEEGEVLRRVLQEGADDLLRKPLTKPELLAHVERLVVEGPTRRPDAVPEPAPGAAPRLRVLAVGLRPGQAEVGCGGALLLHRRRRDRVTLLTLSRERSGEGGATGTQAAAAGRALDVRWFVGNAGSGTLAFEEDLRRLCREALREVRPELLYLPTRRHPLEAVGIVHDTLVGEATSDSVLAYNPGDARATFRPDRFVPIESVLTEKARAIGHFDPALGDPLTPDFVTRWARFWAAHCDGRPAEPFETIRGAPPDDLAEAPETDPERPSEPSVSPGRSG